MDGPCFLIVGSLNREAPYFQGARGVGLSVLLFDERTGTAREVCRDGSIDNPTYLSVDPDTLCIYANSEVFGWHEGTVSAYRFDPDAGRLRYINKQPSLGGITAYNSLTQDGRHLLVANYAMHDQGDGPDRAVVTYPIRADGGLGAPLSWATHEGRGPDAALQERAHPHCIVPSPDGAFAIVADLGLDALISYGLGSDGHLSSQPVAVTRLRPGAGPRHLAFHPGGRHALVICELDSTVAALSYAPATGQFALESTVATVPDAARGANHCSDIQVHPEGRFAYGANRGHNSVTHLRFDAKTGHLTVVEQVPCGGTTPRCLAMSPSGKYLLVANQNSDDISVFAIDQESGRLSRMEAVVPIGSPMCLKLADHHSRRPTIMPLG